MTWRPGLEGPSYVRLEVSARSFDRFLWDFVLDLCVAVFWICKRKIVVAVFDSSERSCDASMSTNHSTSFLYQPMIRCELLAEAGCRLWCVVLDLQDQYFGFCMI